MFVCACVHAGTTHAHRPADGAEEEQEEKPSGTAEGGGATQETLTP